jgi:nickel-dependent lactate racemase
MIRLRSRYPTVNCRVSIPSAMPAVISELSAAGVAAPDIQVLVALGAHRPMRCSEMEQKYTAGLVAKHRFILPNWKDPGEYTPVDSIGDFPIRIHREFTRADFVIGVGQTVPHLIASFCVGCKIIGASDFRVEQMHKTAEFGILCACKTTNCTNGYSG